MANVIMSNYNSYCTRFGYINLSIIQIIQKRRLSYFDHVVRMNEERYPNMLLYGQIEGTRPRGRPKKKWIDNIQEDCSDMGLTVVESRQIVLLVTEADGEYCYTEVGLPARVDYTSSSTGH